MLAVPTAVPPQSGFSCFWTYPRSRCYDRLIDRNAESLVALAPDEQEHIVRPYYLIIQGADSSERRRVDFEAESPDHAFQIARNEHDGTNVELWEGEILLARMTKGEAEVWKLLPVHPDNMVEIGSAPRIETTAPGLVSETGG